MTIEERYNSLFPKQIKVALEAYQIFYPESIIDFIERYCYTYDPRQKNKVIPFILYDKQKEYIQWLWDRYQKRESGAVDKARDVGASWLSIAFSVYLLLFQSNTSTGVYSFKADSVDKIGDVSTLLGKARFILDNLPRVMTKGIKSNYFYIRNDNGSDISGSSGDQPDRGGRRSIYFKDESAFYERPEMIEAALSETSDCIIDISTHQGTNTLFYQKVSSGSFPVFVFEWFSNPNHTKEMYNKKKEIAMSQGLLHIFEREINRNPGASVDSVVVPLMWVRSAVQNKILKTGKIVAGLDVADGGTDTNALCIMSGNDTVYLEEWTEEDVGLTLDRAFWKCCEYGVEEFRYDCIGVGAGIAGPWRVIKELLKTKKSPSEREKIGINMRLIPWSAAGKVINPYRYDYGEKTNEELLENAKSQAYWKAREEFRNTYRMINDMEFDETKVISLYTLSKQLICNKLMNELSQPQKKSSASGKIMIDKKPNGTKSPNLAEAFIMCRAEVYLEWIKASFD